MSFVSIDFLVFLAVTLCGHRLLSSRPARIWLLTAASYVFYAWWDWRFCGLMLVVTTNAYVAGLFLGDPASRHRKLVMAGTICVDLAVLGFFKYFNFFLENLRAASAYVGIGVSWPVMNVLLPIGISFYTFHAMSYVFDVYRAKIRPERSFVKVALYIAFFPQLIAGPIVRASFFLPQLSVDRRFRAVQWLTGAKLLLVGFIYKMIADQFAGLADPIFAHVGHHFNNNDNEALVTAAVSFYAQIYFDFAGYSNMAIGTARLFGYRFPKNFDYPYSSLSVTEFWRRWHISLSSWLRDYLYVPLGGNRNGTAARDRNLIITMVLGGLWHGASWNFVIWGALHGLGLLAHKAWLRLKPSTGPGAGSPLAGAAALVLTQTWVFLAWIFFRANTLTDATQVLGAVFSPGISVLFSPEQPAVWILLVVATDHVLGRFRPKKALEPEAVRHPAYWVLAGLIAAIGLCLMPLSQKPFIYFQF